jgi:hypothetical protein
MPPDGSTLRGPVELVWVSAGQLKSNEYYVVALVDEQTGEYFFRAVRSPSLSVPSEWEPAPGASRSMAWSVEAAVLDAQTGQYIPVSGRSPSFRFVWQGR